MPDLTADDFDGLADRQFSVHLDDGPPVTLRLVEVARGRSAPGYREGFSLLFEGPDDPLLGQGTWPLHHPQLGRLELFLVPVGRASYQAVFG